MWLCQYDGSTSMWEYCLVVGSKGLYVPQREWNEWDQPNITLQEGGCAKGTRSTGTKEEDELEVGARDAWLSKVFFPAGRGEEEQSYIHLVSPSHTPQPSSPSLFGWPGGLDGILGAV